MKRTTGADNPVCSEEVLARSANRPIDLSEALNSKVTPDDREGQRRSLDDESISLVEALAGTGKNPERDK